MTTARRFQGGMSHPSDFSTTRTGGASGAEAQTTLRLQHADRLPAWLCLWLPLALAVALVLAWLLAPEFYRDYLGGDIGILDLPHVIIPMISVNDRRASGRERACPYV